MYCSPIWSMHKLWKVKPWSHVLSRALGLNTSRCLNSQYFYHFLSTSALGILGISSYCDYQTMYKFYFTEESHIVEEFQFWTSKFALIWKEWCLDGFYELKFLKKIDTNGVHLYEKPPSNLQVQSTTIANRMEHLQQPYVERDNLLKRRLKRVCQRRRSTPSKAPKGKKWLEIHARNCDWCDWNCSKAYFLVYPQTGIALPIAQLAILDFLLHESLDKKHIYTVEKAEDQ
jgi:hypothetical protein